LSTAGLPRRLVPSGTYHRGDPTRQRALFRLSSGGEVIGILYNFTHGGRMLAYQSGFAYRADEKRAKPGLTCHRRAIEAALDAGLDCYDFLAGGDRYKRSLADAGAPADLGNGRPALVTAYAASHRAGS
jgi:CelD/BcsL family acetyltransferase involved in cellulose biosynthesis